MHLFDDELAVFEEKGKPLGEPVSLGQVQKLPRDQENFAN